MSNEKFQLLIEEFLRVWASYNPFSAFEKGWREFAGQIPNYSLARINAYKLLLLNTIKSLKAIDIDSLTRISQIDYLVFENKILADLFNIDDLKIYTTQPMTYIEPAFIFDYLLKKYAPLDQRLREMCEHLNQLPEFYQTAIKQLQWDKCAPENMEMTLKMLTGMISFLENITSEVKELESEFDKISEKTFTILDLAKKTGLEGIELFVSELKNRLPEANGNYRLGKVLFEKMLVSTERIQFPLEQILEVGERDLKHNYDELKKAAKKIDPNKTVDEIAREIRKDHPTADSLIPEITEMLEKLRQYIIDENFVSVPSDVMPTVIQTPKPYREWEFAAMDTPGPLEKKATDSYYYITPPEKDWSEQEKEEWLETFNYKGLLDISAHEAFPGHYLHHLHYQQSKSLMSKLFGAYHFDEGWALYVEEAMWQNGFQAGDYQYRIAQLFETLLRNVRLVVAIKLHTEETFTLENGINMFMKYAFLGRKPAESEAKRATYDPGYLNYALGKLMVEKLRKDYEEEKNNQFSLKEFHDELLSYGAPPIPILRKFMINNKNNISNIL
ncbi:MAG: DUF885 domain-containing protein [Candidatus Hodarchaeales archaeon]|jgi:uncharacterized protein (DUF885 family)